jgi:hypothetical protein
VVLRCSFLHERTSQVLDKQAKVNKQKQSVNRDLQYSQLLGVRGGGVRWGGVGCPLCKVEEVILTCQKKCVYCVIPVLTCIAIFSPPYLEEGQQREATYMMLPFSKPANLCGYIMDGWFLNSLVHQPE